MSQRQLRMALVGCGQIADAHLQEVRKLNGVEVVGVCDRHLELAEQVSARFGRPTVFADLDTMLRTARPDVVHVTTPPQTHRPIAIAALRAGAHVYVEKPFAVNLAEADEILGTAKSVGRLVCVGHDHLFDPAWERCRALYQSGRLGRVVHVDSVQGYDLDGPFGRVAMADPEHWIHQLPGGVFHNTISHAVYKITEFLPDERPDIWATWFSADGQTERPTDLRVMLKGREVTANLICSAFARPTQRLARVYGTRQCVEVDLDGRLLRRSRSAIMPGSFAKIEAPFRHLTEAAVAVGRSVRHFLRCDLHFFTGMRRLFESFYHAAAEGGEPPIPYAEIRRVTVLMDRIFESCRGEAQSPIRPADGRADAASRRDWSAPIVERV